MNKDILKDILLILLIVFGLFLGLVSIYFLVDLMTIFIKKQGAELDLYKRALEGFGK